ncbi:hypothetical protein Clacol_006762 [Clathrus columnatus]|uniref:P/Homo B domain-containing protein n=1 Tax=Clathrus columnatus TaxID=1419009 RepID=A0AAV5AIK6_9AGAM|nr:hypothetical protein Clacol_006762 [Clathrus columnatus]
MDLEHDPQASASIAEITAALDVELLDQIGPLTDFWLVRVSKSRKRHVKDVLGRYGDLRSLANAQSNRRSTESLHARHIVTSISKILPQQPRQRNKRDAYYAERAPPPSRPPINVHSSANAIASRLQIKDPIFSEQWHFVNEEYPQNTMNVTPVWEDLGLTGKGVYVAMVDDGLDYTHNDLKDNFFKEGSYDFNDHESLPTPKLSDDHHGTRCAGQISAVKNDVCGLGIAYNSKIAGLRILSGPISDVDEALALNYAYQNTSIYSCSWGPPDDGRSMEGPAYLIQKAVLEGVTTGRGGKGSIFVFASGNGAASGDQCNFDGYTNSIFSVTVGAIDYKGLHPYYSEACAANMIVTYSSGNGKSIATTDVGGKDKCTSTHGGTSAAAPFASAVFALALEARPDLTWRDIQHLCVTSAVPINLDDPDWDKTAVGRPYSYTYGYGLLDTWHFVNAAKSWKLVKPQAWIDLPVIELGGGKVDEENNMLGGLSIPPGGVSSKLTITREMLSENNFEDLEHVTIKIWVNHTKRGDVEVELISPNGVHSVLAKARPRDSSASGYPGWTFMTLKHWSESPIGEWTIRVSDKNDKSHKGYFLGWTMSLFGSSVDAVAAKPYVLKADTPSPGNPIPIQLPTPTNGTTKTYPKPTEHLPGDPGAIPGETDKPAIPTPESTLDEGYFTGMSHLLKNSTWLIFSIAAVILFGIGATIYFCRRQRRLRDYDLLNHGEDVPMVDHGAYGSSGGGRDRARTKELYDAFGEVSDDEEASVRRPLTSNEHSEYPENESGSRYKDEPEPKGRVSPGSNDGSWEHA